MADLTSMPRILCSLIPTYSSETAGLTGSPWPSLTLALMFTTELSRICLDTWKLTWCLKAYVVTVTGDMCHSLPSMEMPKFQVQW